MANGLDIVPLGLENGSACFGRLFLLTRKPHEQRLSKPLRNPPTLPLYHEMQSKQASKQEKTMFWGSLQGLRAFTKDRFETDEKVTQYRFGQESVELLLPYVM